MYTVLNAKQMREVDSYMINEMHIPGILLMENAAMGVCRHIMQHKKPCTVHVYCGTGNNGGDGLAVARLLLTHGYDVYVIVAGESLNMTADTATNFKLFGKWRQRAACFTDIADFYGWELPPADVVVDALFGTGLTRTVEGLYRSLIEYMNAQDAWKVSVDIPSGIHSDTGEVMGIAVLADQTVTFQYPKLAHLLYPGREYAGEVHAIRIGVDDGCPVLAEAKVVAYTAGDGNLTIARRTSNTNKGDYGRLLLVAGSQGMAGAAVLSARAASRVGVGLVTLASTDEVVQVVQQTVPEATCKIVSNEEGRLDRRSIFDIARIVKNKSAMAVGPGLGVGAGIQELVEHALKHYNLPKVLDADAINALSGKTEALLEHVGEVILTPHPKEFARLLDIDVATVLQNPVGHACDFAKKYGVVLVLKGATTIVAESSGKVALFPLGSPGMAKGGSGDVLTGMIGGWVAQGKTAWESALLGVYIAAMAGEKAAREIGEYAMLPMDTISHIGAEIEKITVKNKRSNSCGLNSSSLYHVVDEKEEIRTVETPVRVSVEKTAEQALAEIEKIEKTQEIKKELLEAAGIGNKTDEPTRRRIG